MSQTPAYVGYIAMSLDGYIADKAGGVGWLDPFNAALAEAGSDGGFEPFIYKVDALLMGRLTYEQVIGRGWPYGDRAGYVLTQTEDYTGDHIVAAGSTDTLRSAIEAAGHQTVWIMGGGAAQRAALDAGMFQSLRVFIMPTLLGGGRPLFTDGKQHNLKLTSSQQLAGGILQIDYNIGD